MNDILKKAQKIEDLTGEIRELIDEGFYPEEYLRYCRSIENKLSEMEELTGDLYMIARKLNKEKNEKTKII